ncbi:DUF6225 family protein [Streptomyces antimicrobicus]|uniref:DUF6225 family protein n=1 Tax=Streptomyces antimicrobicus TaxID=2883108 RepID=A0ABS8BDS4_9ACTN|nr:DUF6225 family protein [Streptomyces antimicrobicus]MCB5182741.1 DUF6225 family protein [Streptomyces antimicrobicus]
MADTFEHAPQVWTAARLRSALDGLPDDTPIHVGVADGPGNFEGYEEFVLVSAEPVETEPDEDGGAPTVQFTLFADAKAGVYYLDMD